MEDEGSGERPAVARRGRVLIVDDELLLAGGLRLLLEPHHDVNVADSGRAGLARLAAGERFDVILCDIIMPGMDGLLFFQAVRREHPEHAPRIVFMTGGILAAATRRLASVVPNTILEKPFEPEALLALVRSRVHDADRTPMAAAPTSR